MAPIALYPCAGMPRSEGGVTIPVWKRSLQLYTLQLYTPHSPRVYPALKHHQ